MKKVKCIDCGTEGTLKNPLGIQGRYKVRYCCDCLNKVTAIYIKK